MAMYSTKKEREKNITKHSTTHTDLTLLEAHMLHEMKPALGSDQYRNEVYMVLPAELRELIGVFLPA